MANVRKKSGFKNYNDTFWINEKGKYGCRYQCKHCGRDTLGMVWGEPARKTMHWSDCPTLTPEPDLDAKAEDAAAQARLENA